MKRIKFILPIILFSTGAAAQADTTRELSLEEVVVKAFEQNRRLRDVPAAVNYIGSRSLGRFHDVSVVAAINTMPGVRMEERSPGSYRINVRGSSSRSPFGVRNVKIYYNDLPYTDPGGQTYLNQLGFYNIKSVEIIKGPGSSLYGAGTGGVMLIESLKENENGGLQAGYTTGSNNLVHAHAAVTTSSEKFTSRYQYQHLQTSGYRDQSKMRRDVVSWNGVFRTDDKRQLKTSFLYSDLFYQTPGALNLTEYNANPKAARPGAANAKAAIYQKTFLAGASYTQRIDQHISNKSVLYGAFTELRNPNLRGYDRSSEPHAGGRSIFTFNLPFDTSSFVFHLGAEWQQGFGTTSSFKNVGGNADSIRYQDDVRNRQSFVFAQAIYDIASWSFTAGASWNQLNIKAQRFTPKALGEQKRNFDNEIAPRFTVLKKFKNLTTYAGASKGFSSPTTSELLPTGGNINLALDAEYGTNYDAGLRGTFLNKLYVDVNGFYFSLKNTIVQRRDALGGDFYVNAGKTKQYGVETYINYPFVSAFTKNGLLWLSHTWHRFRYKEFVRGTQNFSGKKVPGEPRHAVAGGLDLTIFKLQTALTYAYTGKLPLNDANTFFANDVHLLALKVAYEKSINRLAIKLFAGVENILDEKYSLGNDINGFGGRFYNAATGRNYYAGLQFSLPTK